MASTNETQSTAPTVAATPYRQIRAHHDATTITVYQAYNATIAAAAVAAQKLHASPAFRPTRMTWIKPSWAWMLYRAGYSYKDAGQERILALTMRRADFVGLLERAVLTHGHGAAGGGVAGGSKGEGGSKGARETAGSGAEVDSGESGSAEGDGKGKDKGKEGKAKRWDRRRDPAAAKAPDVKVQWDPERTVRLERLDYRSIQIGIPAAVSPTWTAEWIVGIEDVTDRARELKRVLDERPEVTDAELVELGLVPVERPFEVSEELQLKLSMNER